MLSFPTEAGQAGSFGDIHFFHLFNGAIAQLTMSIRGPQGGISCDQGSLLFCIYVDELECEYGVQSALGISIFALFLTRLSMDHQAAPQAVRSRLARTILASASR